MSRRRSSIKNVVMQTAERTGAQRFARRCARDYAPRLAGSKAAASSTPDNPLGRAQPLTTIISQTLATVQRINILASDQAAQLQSP